MARFYTVLFNSLTFLCFFAIVWVVYRLALPWTLKKLHLTVASYVFYAAWNPPFVVLLWISTVIDWFVAKRIAKAQSAGRKRALLVLSLSSNLGILGFFKYGEFLNENFTAVMRGLGVEFSPLPLDIILPVGISFYTFQTLSYTLDVYRGRLEPCKSFVDFALFVGFFPQLVAGPIVRAADFLPQCVEPKRPGGAQIGWGLSLLAIGMFQKVIVSDAMLAPVADRVYDAATDVSVGAAWLGTLAFSSQIFFDFSGYTLCAIGVGMCLGFVLPDNFRFPYAAIGFSDFWRRWHMSLSTWLRDYLYISLGGNRHGRLRTHVNLMLTMLLGGLWHGASWRFVVWGGLHGTYLVAERVLRSRLAGVAWLRQAWLGPVYALLTYALVCVTWVFFRAGSFADAWSILQAMFAIESGALGLNHVDQGRIVGITGVVLVGHWYMRDHSLEQLWGRIPWGVRAVLLALMLVSLALVPGDDRAFIYFQF